MNRDPDPREFEPNPEDEREVPLDEDEDGFETPPPTLDPEERLEAEAPDDAPLDDERPA
jgi:hypothetical protein